ncbi:hypothetical protein ES705_28674 [subsurface metagenome]
MDKADEEMVQAARETDQLSTETRADQKARMEQEIATETLMILVGAIIAVIFGLLMAVLITLSITGAMKKGVEFARSIAAGDDKDSEFEPYPVVVELSEDHRNIIKWKSREHVSVSEKNCYSVCWYSLFFL